MRLSSKVTWGLAWAGLALVIAVPSLDAFSGNSAAPALITSDTDQVKVASATPAVTSAPAATTPTTPKPGSVTINPDGTVVRSSSATAAPTLATATTPPAATETKTAEAEEAAPPLVAPIPAPASARPKSQPAATTTPPPVVASAPPATPLVIDEPVPEVEIDDPDDLIPPEDIPEDDPAALRAYLEARGLLEPYDGRSTASVQYIEPPPEDLSDDYDPDGFYLSDGPNSDRQTTRRSARSGWWYDEYGNLIFY